MPGRCVVGGCSAFPDVQNGLILHAIPFLNDELPEARKRRKKWIDFVKQKRAKWEPTQNSSVCSRHFTENDYVCRFSQLRRRSDQEADHAKAETRRNQHKRCAICSCRSGHQKTSCQWKCETLSRTRGKICQMFRGISWFICTAKTKASEIIIFIFNLELL